MGIVKLNECGKSFLSDDSYLLSFVKIFSWRVYNISLWSIESLDSHNHISSVKFENRKKNLSSDKNVQNLRFFIYSFVCSIAVFENHFIVLSLWMEILNFYGLKKLEGFLEVFYTSNFNHFVMGLDQFFFTQVGVGSIFVGWVGL